MQPKPMVVGAGESCCSRCRSADGFEPVTAPRFRDPMRGMAKLVLVPSLIAIAVSCLAFLWLGNRATPDSEPVIVSSMVRAVLGFAIVLGGAAGALASGIVLATKHVDRCVRCGAIEEHEARSTIG